MKCPLLAAAHKDWIATEMGKALIDSRLGNRNGNASVSAYRRQEQTLPLRRY